MKKSAFIKAAAALGLACGLITPVSAQVSTGLQQAAFGGTVTGGNLTPASTGFGALSTVGVTTTTINEGTTPGQQVSASTTKTSGSGGKVGTFQASLSEGDQQRFAVGTSTNIGVNATSSSTSDYQANSTATFGFGSSTLRQSIGTSGSTQSVTQRDQAKASYVEQTASTSAAQSASTSVGSSAESYYNKASANATTTGNTSTSTGYSWWNSGYQNTGTNKTWNQLSSDEQKSVSASYQQAYNSSYNTAYSSASTSAATSYDSSASANEAATGVISGSFVSSSASSATPTSENANNQVTVRGIGNAANVNAAGNSVFNSAITARPGTPAAGTSGTASGSAGANVSTTASADAAATKFSSVYIQSY